jgi:hypothetical protein
MQRRSLQAVRLLGQVNPRIRSRLAKRDYILPLTRPRVFSSLSDQGSNMATVIKIAGKLYLIQAAIGFTAGFFIPWLKIFHAAG